MAFYPSRQSGFTLIEIMIVVVIVGLLASMAIPAFTKSRMASQNSRLANDFRIFSNQIEVFVMETGTYPENSATGDIPTGLEEYIHVSQWESGPTIGGQWDVEYDAFGIISAIGVHGYNVDEVQIELFDEKFDDNDVSSGRFRKLAADRYYLVIAE